jgi:hypothetical protein
MERDLKYNGVMAQISGEEDCAAVSGLLSRDSVTSWDIFFEVLTFKSVLSVYALMVFKVFQKLCFSLPYTIINILLLLLVYLLILKMPSLLRITYSVIGRCSLVLTSHWLHGKCAIINL